MEQQTKHTGYIDYDGRRYWYEYRLAKHGVDICLATEDPNKYCNGLYLYSDKDPGNGMAFVVVKTDPKQETKLYAINYAGYWTIQTEPHYGIESDVLNEESCKDAERYANLFAEAPITSAERDSLKEFKRYVHERLDKMGIPENPDPIGNASHGCRIEGRLDVIELSQRERDKLKEEVERLTIYLEKDQYKDWNKLKEENERLKYALEIAHGLTKIDGKNMDALRDINKSLVEALKDCIKSDQVEGFIIDEVRLRSIDLINQSKNS